MIQMLKFCLFAALVFLTICAPLKLPAGISLLPRISDYSSNDTTIPAHIVKDWFIDEVLRRDPDLSSQRQMIRAFFDESIGVGALARNLVAEKIDWFTKKEFPKKVDAMQEYLIRLYKVDRTDSEFIDEMKKHPESYFLTYDTYKVLKDYTEEPDRVIGEL